MQTGGSEGRGAGGRATGGVPAMCRGVGEVRVEVHTSKIEVGRGAILMQGVCFVLLTNVLQHMPLYTFLYLVA